jgi:hypothetical protein
MGTDPSATTALEVCKTSQAALYGRWHFRSVKKAATDRDLILKNNLYISILYAIYARRLSRTRQAARGDANLAAIGSAFDP